MASNLASNLDKHDFRIDKLERIRSDLSSMIKFFQLVPSHSIRKEPK